MKKLFSIVILSILITSCSVKKDVPVQIIASSLGEHISNFENMAEASDDYVKYCMNSDMAIFSEYIILYPFSGTEYTEIGIFKISDENKISDGIKIIDGYINFKKENWDTRYMDDEFAKIENAKITSCGPYILYTILDANESKQVIKKFKNQLY